MNALKRELKQLIIDTVKLSDVTPDKIEDSAPLFGEGLGLDSLDALELAVAFEYKYGVGLDLEHQDEAKKVLRSIDTLAEYIHTHRQSQPKQP
jgi:acyl carrier protein